MNIRCGKESLTTPCTGCLCHSFDIQFGESHNGQCAECGCPKTKAAFDQMKKEARHGRSSAQRG